MEMSRKPQSTRSTEGRHADLDFYDLLIEALKTSDRDISTIDDSAATREMFRT